MINEQPSLWMEARLHKNMIIWLAVMFSNRTRTKGRRWCTTPLLYHPERYSWVYAKGRERKEDGKIVVCDKRDRDITCVFCCDLERRRQKSCVWQTWQGYYVRVLLWSGPLQKDLFKGKWSLAKSCFKQNYCHACHTRFAVFFPLTRLISES